MQIGDIRTNLWRAGNESNPAVILVHDGGYGSDAISCWGAFLELLSERFYVLAPDLAGFGETDKVIRFDQDPLIQRVNHLDGICQALGVERASFVGASFGGAVVLRAALERLSALERAVTISGTGGLFFVEDRFDELQNYSPSLEDSRKIWDFLARNVSDEMVEGRYERSLAKGHWEALSAARLRNPAAEPSSDRMPAYKQALSKLEVPVMFIAGEDDPLLKRGWEKSMADLVPNSIARLVPGALHEPFVDLPEAVATLVSDFALGTD